MLVTNTVQAFTQLLILIQYLFGTRKFKLGFSNRRRLHGATLHATRQRVHSPASEKIASKLTTPIIRKNKNAGQSALYFSFRHVRDEPQSFRGSSQATYSTSTLGEFASGTVNWQVSGEQSWNDFNFIRSDLLASEFTRF
jgi:hypothetical protein